MVTDVLKSLKDFTGYIYVYLVCYRRFSNCWFKIMVKESLVVG